MPASNAVLIHLVQQRRSGELTALIDARTARFRLPAVKIHEALHHRRPDTEPADPTLQRSISLHEHVEDARHLLRRNADGAIADLCDDLVPVALNRDSDLSALVRELACIVQEVAEGLG